MSKGSMFESYLHNENGLIAWRRGTGDNVEITYIRVDEKRKGSGKNLLMDMIKELEWNPPYHTIFGFTRVSNHDARNFYRSMGFVLTEVTGVYADGKAILFSAPFTYLQELHLGNAYRNTYNSSCKEQKPLITDRLDLTEFYYKSVYHVVDAK